MALGSKVNIQLIDRKTAGFLDVEADGSNLRAALDANKRRLPR
jgi:hypothetical protein